MMIDHNAATKGAAGWAIVFMFGALVGAFASMDYAWLLMAAAAINVGIAIALRGVGSVGRRKDG